MSLVDLGKKLLESAKLGETDEVRTLMTNGAPFTTDWLGTSPLHMAAQYGHETTAEVLLRAGISRDARTKVDRTPLHVAAQEGHLNIVELLIKHGAEVDARDMLKMTPLHWAVERGHIHVASTLLKNDADINAVSKFDKSPLDIAEDNNHRELFQMLVQHAANPGRIKQYQPISKTVHRSENNQNALGQTIKSLPLIIRTEAISVSQIKNAVNRTLPQSIQATLSSPTTTSISTAHNANPSTMAKPVFLHANLANIQRMAAGSSSHIKASSSDSEEGETTTEQSCTNVLATLAALAEATAPNATISTSEALQWLEMNGITMLPTDNSTVVASALEGGQTVSLTEAGKLALTWVKEHQNQNNSSSEVSSSVSDGRSVQGSTVSTSQTTPNQKVITIVADQSHIPSIMSSQQTPIVVLSSQNVPTTVGSTSPPNKKIKSFIKKKIEPRVSTNGTDSDQTDSIEDDRMKLKNELEKMKKQAEQYKAQLLLKEHEAEQYRKQLEQIRTVPRVNQ